MSETIINEAQDNVIAVIEEYMTIHELWAAGAIDLDVEEADFHNLRMVDALDAPAWPDDPDTRVVDLIDDGFVLEAHKACLGHVAMFNTRALLDTYDTHSEYL